VFLNDAKHRLHQCLHQLQSGVDDASAELLVDAIGEMFGVVGVEQVQVWVEALTAPNQIRSETAQQDPPTPFNS
jgi:hypothetical protein